MVSQQLDIVTPFEPKVRDYVARLPEDSRILSFPRNFMLNYLPLHLWSSVRMLFGLVV